MQVVTTTETKPSRKLIAEWARDEQVGIWDNCTATIRLYADRAVYKGNTVRWVNNSGSLAALNRRITGAEHRKLLELATQQVEDESDYTDDAFEAVMYSLE